MPFFAILTTTTQVGNKTFRVVVKQAMGEFEEVGNTVKAFASDNATVVVGTVIDPNMEDEIRVTVVATGISCEARQK